MFFMVFAGTKQSSSSDDSDKYIAWSGPIAVFEADSAEEACQSCAKKVGWMGSYFAIEGFPWGVELFEAPAREFGADTKLTRREEMELRTRELERTVLEDHSTVDATT